MAANFKPIFTLTPNPGKTGVLVTVANTTRDLTAGTIYYLFTAGANGAYIDRIVWQGTGATAGPSVGRMWLTNATGPGVATDVTLLGEISLPTQTISEVAASPPLAWNAGFAIPATWRIYLTLGTVAAAGFYVTAPGSGDY